MIKNKKGMDRFLPKSKKAAEMTIGTIIVIILALVVLVVLIYGFTTGWANLFEKIGVFGGGKANVQTIVQGCQLACTTSSEYDWCTKQRKIIVDDAANEGKTIPLKEKTCKELSLNTKYGLEDCTGISCVSTTKKCTGTANACNTFDEISCPAQKVCKWNTQTKLCEGTTTSCDVLGETDCANQKECILS